MPSENNKRLQRLFAPLLKQRGFKKTAATWRKKNGDTIAVFNIQGSSYGPQFYINLGVYFRALGDLDEPAAYRCHIREGLESILPDRYDRERMIWLLDFEQAIPDHVRARELEEMVVQYCLPWLETVCTVRGAREYVSSLHPRNPFVTKEARAFLAQDPQ